MNISSGFKTRLLKFRVKNTAASRVKAMIKHENTCSVLKPASASLAILFLLNCFAQAEDWPMWGYDASRRGITPVELSETLHLQWIREMPEPRRAWRRQVDDWDKLEFDLSYSPVAMGGSLFVPSMVTDRLTAYDIDTGRELWRYYVDGPVRLAPAAWDGKVYFVSDDGHLYCLDADTGSLQWKFDARAAGHRVLGNERVISMWPARGGPLVKEGKVYFASGVWPFLGTFIYALDAKTGSVEWANTGHSTDWQRQPHLGSFAFAGLSPQGYLAASDDRLVVSGARAEPGVFNLKDGALIHSRIDGKSTGASIIGGYRVRIDGEFYYNHGRRYRLSDGRRAGGGSLKNEALLAGVEKVQDWLDSGVFEFFAARGRLFIVTEKGTIYCFGPEDRDAVIHAYLPQSPRMRTDAPGIRAEEMLSRSGASGGYALFLGAGNGDLIEQVALRSELHVVAVEQDKEIVEALRRRFDDAGLYGTRITLLHDCPLLAHYPEYISSLIVMDDPEATGRMPDAGFLETVYKRLRPYNGMAFIRDSTQTREALRLALAGFEPENGAAFYDSDTVILVREGPLPGSGEWTHHYADSAQSVMSHDERVRPPFGPIWFGGPTHDNVLPRHAPAGPRPQIAGGNIVLLGAESLSARCVFTGRELWVREFPGVGHPFTVPEQEEIWGAGNYVGMATARRATKPGSIPYAGGSTTFIGSPFVTLPDSIYVRYEERILRLDPATGETLDEWPLPASPEERDLPDWGHLSISGDMLITTTNPHIFSTPGGETWGDYTWDGTSSARLVVMNRYTGEVAWTRDAVTGFRHNAIVSENGRLFVYDLLSERALVMALRRGLEVVESPCLYALDLATGEVLWAVKDEVFGTFLSYSAEHDILVEGGINAGGRLPYEIFPQIAARRGGDGALLWSLRSRQSRPVILRGDMIIPEQPGPAICLLTGSDYRRIHPVTGEETDWSYWRSYGCGGASASTHLLLFRSAAAGFADLEHGGGTGTIGGFRAGCIPNIIAADGVLNAPDYTRTCGCNYQLQTSLGLIHMPEMEMWTVNPPIQTVRGSISRLGINFNAPGDRRADNGTLWTPFPVTTPHAPETAVAVKTVDYADVPVNIIDARTSYFRWALNKPEYTVDGDPSTVWEVRSEMNTQFQQWIRYELDKPVSLDRVEVAWTGPKDTQFSIETSIDGSSWTVALEEESRGTGDEMDIYRFDPVQAKHVRLSLGAHADMSDECRHGRSGMQPARIYNVRIGDLPYPAAYARLMPHDTFRKHSLLVDGTAGLNWVASSGIRGIRYFELPDVNGGSLPYTVILHFAEPDGLGPGQRVFDVYVQGRELVKGFDISAAAGGPDRAVTLTARGVPVNGPLRVELKPASVLHPPVLSGVEIFKENQGENRAG